MDGGSQDASLLEGSPVYKATVVPRGASHKDRTRVKSGAIRQYATALTGKNQEKRQEQKVKRRCSR